MELQQFRKKLKQLHEKSEMDAFSDWPFVYDEDESGRIYVNSTGTFYFADSCSNWVESPLQLSNVANIRYAKAFEDPGIDNDCGVHTESYIFIHFTSGDCIELFNLIDRYEIEITVFLQKNDDNALAVDTLKTSCHSQNSKRLNIVIS